MNRREKALTISCRVWYLRTARARVGECSYWRADCEYSSCKPVERNSQRPTCIVHDLRTENT